MFIPPIFQFFFRHIQESCKRVWVVLFSLIFIVGCGSSESSKVELISFDDSSVSFVDTSCSVQFTMVNSSDSNYVLSLLSATFEDEDGNTFQTEMDSEGLAGLIDPLTIPPLGFSTADITFDLSASGLTPPISATVIVVGVGSSQITHFIGNFTCE